MSLPLIGQAHHIVRNLNFVKTMWMHPCSAPLTIYIETFLPAFINAFWTFEFGKWEHEVKHEVGLARGHAVRRLEHGLTRATPLFELSGTKFLFQIAGVAFPATMFLYFAEIISNGLVAWTSSLYSTVYCSAALDSGPYQRSVPSTILLAISGWTSIAFTSLDQNRGNWGNSAFSVSLPPGQYNATGFCEIVEALGLYATGIEARVMNLTTNTPLAIESIGTLSPHGVGRGACSAAIIISGPLPNTISFEMRCQTSDLNINTTGVFIVAGQTKLFQPDYGPLNEKYQAAKREQRDRSMDAKLQRRHRTSRTGPKR